MFLWFQLYIEVLIRMHHHNNVKQEFINICRENYRKNLEELEIIDEFEKNYHPDRAIWWYTRECCFYRILNKALRVQDFDMLFVLRFFITDISKQLKQIHRSDLRSTPSRKILQVYRGQAIGLDELEIMQTSVGKYLSMNSFLSTSLQRSTAMEFSYNSELIGDMERILYEISIDPREKTKAYGDISSISYLEKEHEVLIMLGAFFRIDEIEKDEDEDIWIAHLTLVSDDNDQLKAILVYMKEKIEQETNLSSLGKILIEMGKYDQALKYSKQMMREAKLNQAKALEIQAKADALKGNFKGALECSTQIMTIFDEIGLSPDCQERGQLFSSMGAVYCQQGTYNDALFNLDQALEIQKKILPSNHADICETYHHYADCYDCKGKVDLALQYYEKCLLIQQETLPKDHPAIASTYNDIGVMYDSRKKIYSKALEYYQKSLEISHKILPPQHPEVQRTEDNIKQLKMKMKNQ
jgi:tetratricopeptide (TPR) repeat protein